MFLLAKHFKGRRAGETAPESEVEQTGMEDADVEYAEAEDSDLDDRA
jgi:23S rRNA (uridine2552-2'-O)-methyltransferase